MKIKNVDLTAIFVWVVLKIPFLKSVQYLDINLEYLGKNLTGFSKSSRYTYSKY